MKSLTLTFEFDLFCLVDNTFLEGYFFYNVGMLLKITALDPSIESNWRDALCVCPPVIC